MKLLYIFLIFIINIYAVNAEITLFKETYSPKETFQAELSFKNLVEEIKPVNIVILNSDNQPTNIGLLLKKINEEKYFVYFEVPEIEDGPYFLAVKNVKYLDSGILKKESFLKEFSIKNEEENLISVKPPIIVFVFEDKNFFKIDIKNNGNNILNLKMLEESNSTNLFNNNLTIAKNSEDSFYFILIEDQIKERDKLNIKLSYNEKIFFLPVYILKSRLKETLAFYTENEKTNLFSLELEIQFGNYVEKSLFIENNLNQNLTNLSIQLSDNLKDLLKLGFYKIEVLKNKTLLELPFFINQNRNKPIGIYNGNLIIQNNEINTVLPITINIIENKIYKDMDEDENNEDVSESPSIEPVKNVFEIPKINQTEKEIKKLDKKKITYISIGSVILFFLLIYFILFIKTSKKKSRY